MEKKIIIILIIPSEGRKMNERPLYDTNCAYLPNIYIHDESIIIIIIIADRKRS